MAGVQRQLLLPLGVSHFCRFRSSWIKINNDDACGPCGRRLRRPKRGGKRAASTVTHCRSARARFSMPLARSTGCSAAGRPGMFTRSTGGGLRATADREHARGEQAPAAISAGSGPFGSLARWKWQPARELAGRADRRLQPRGRRVRSVGTLPNPGRPPRPVSRRGRPGRRRPGRDRKAHNCHLSRGTDGVSPSTATARSATCAPPARSSPPPRRPPPASCLPFASHAIAEPAHP